MKIIKLQVLNNVTINVFAYIANQTLETVIEYNKTLIKLGRGVYGHVYVGCYKGTRVAVKRILRDDLDVDREINAMENLNHENVLKLINKQQDSNFM